MCGLLMGGGNELEADMKERFWRFMDSAKGFWTLILSVIVLGIGWMIGSDKLIEWYMNKRKERR